VSLKIIFNKYVDFVASKTGVVEDVDHGQLKLALIIHLMFTIAFWAYVPMISFFVPSEGALSIMVGAATCFTFSPIFIILFKTLFVFVHFMILCTYIAIIFSLVVYDGGIQSSALVWLSLTSVLSGGILGPKHSVIWGGLILLTVLLLIAFSSYFGPMGSVLLGNGGFYSDAMNWTLYSLLSVVVIVFFVRYQDSQKNTLMQQKNYSSGLLRILIHDISNSIAIVRFKMDQLALDSDLLTTDKYRALDVNLNVSIEILENVKTWASIETGKFDIDARPVRAGDIIEGLSDLFAQALEAKNIKLELIDTSGNASFVVNKSGFRNHVLVNLISNAIKFSPVGGRVVVEVSAGQKLVLFKIIDQGLGMNEILSRSIFDISQPTTRLGTMGEKGTGFGLPIVKSFVDKSGGSIDVCSRPTEEYPHNSGTTFTISLTRCSDT
jgi:signal transduction histidine kinase